VLAFRISKKESDVSFPKNCSLRKIKFQRFLLFAKPIYRKLKMNKWMLFFLFLLLPLKLSAFPYFFAVVLEGIYLLLLTFMDMFMKLTMGMILPK